MSQDAPPPGRDRAPPWRLCVELGAWCVLAAIAGALMLRPPDPISPLGAVATFDGPGGRQGFWDVSNGREFPGAKVWQKPGLGRNGRAMGAAFDIGCRPTGCARYVALGWRPGRPLAVEPGDVLSFHAKTTGDVVILARLYDAAGQTFQTRPVPVAREIWTPIAFPLDFDDMERWGGEGPFEPPLRGISILAGAVEAPVAGGFWVDDVAFSRPASPQTAQTPGPRASLPTR